MQDLTRTVQEAELWLSANDPLLGAIINNGPSLPCKVFNKEPFDALVQAVISQQLSVKSASAIQQRVHRLLPNGELSADAFSRIPAEQLKKAGMSAAKVRTVENLIKFALAKNNRFDALHQLPNPEVKRQLCELKGVGPWTADIFLMFGLKRFDVFAAGDLGLRKAVQQLHKLKELPTADACAIIAEKWQPYRTVAAWHLWQTID